MPPCDRQVAHPITCQVCFFKYLPFSKELLTKTSQKVLCNNPPGTVRLISDSWPCRTVLFPLGRDQFNKLSLVNFSQSVQPTLCVWTKHKTLFFCFLIQIYRFDPTSTIWEQKCLLERFYFGFNTLVIFQAVWL